MMLARATCCLDRTSGAAAACQTALAMSAHATSARSGARGWPRRACTSCAAPTRDGRELPDLLRGAIAGGVDIVQLREKHLADERARRDRATRRARCASGWGRC